ncbi:hypothetical protein LPJ64_005756 [Coemansia asiatica]|uniref:Uncharacterized protein n=1 Tax=Coemansia asiatica TaxID=1052880 RepID=A0A9W7XFU5_9FUNG|nr:hypothetical protein LPJ64_005756 [Coemansia asiatica]
MGGGGVQRILSVPPSSQPVSSPVMINQNASPAISASGKGSGSPAMTAPNLGANMVGGNSFQLNASLAAQQQAAGLQTLSIQNPNMSPGLSQQVAMSPPMGTQTHAQQSSQQPAMVHMSPPQSLQKLQPLQQQQQQQQLPTSPMSPGMQQSQQAMMLATVQAAGLSGAAAQALIAQITANAESSQKQQQRQQQQEQEQQQKPAVATEDGGNNNNNVAASPVTSSSVHPGLKPAGTSPDKAQQSATGSLSPAASNASIGGDGGSVTPTTPSSAQRANQLAAGGAQGKQQVHPRPNRPMRPVIRAQGARPPAAGARKPATPVTNAGALTPRPPVIRPAAPTNTQQPHRPPPVLSNVSTKGGSTPTPSTPVSRATTPNSAVPKLGAGAGAGAAVRAHHPPQSLVVSAATTPKSAQAASGTSTPGSRNLEDGASSSAATESSQAEESTSSPK